MSLNIDSKALNFSPLIDQRNDVLGFRTQLPSSAGAGSFSKILSNAQQSSRVNSLTPPAVSQVTVKSGDTLSSIVKNFLGERGVQASSSDVLRMAQDIAKSSGIQNPDRIFPGQRLNLANLQASLMASPGATQAATPNPVLPSLEDIAMAAPASVQLFTKVDAQANPILQKTLDRAVEKGFIPAQERQAVHDRILQLASEYKFAPDDFARITLMESDGMNPKASNNRCHGIIQFCDGPDRGAASVGFGANPKAILKQSVLQQLDMVAKYFDDTGLKNFGPAGLDDLYLTVLTPAARQETRPHVGLNIAGTQAPHLYVNKDPRSSITRQSILQGLHQFANERLGLDNKPVAQTPQSLPPTRAQLMRVSAYFNPTTNPIR
jgi:hypothetical protein